LHEAWRQKVGAVLGWYAEEIGLTHWRLDADGQTRLTFGSGFVSLGLDATAGEFVLVSPLGRPFPSAHGAALDANSALIAIPAGTVASDATSGALVLFCRLPLEGLEVLAFEAALGAFISQAEDLRNFCNMARRLCRSLPLPLSGP